MSARTLSRVITSIPTSDGGGVRLRRSIGHGPGVRLDPFLMLDEFASEDARDYIAGFPPHPHRGFETVTYMIDGHMQHRDHLGNTGELVSGGVQWMTAGRGIVHSEMPQQEQGRMRGFQLWINLPAREKMKPASYRDLAPAEIPSATLASGVVVRVIAGELDGGDGTTVAGPIQGLTTEPVYFDLAIPPDGRFAHALPASHNAFVYAYEGTVRIGSAAATGRVETHCAGILGDGDEVTITAGPEGARCLLLAGKPLGEAIVQYGPFVMNTRDEIEQAIRDYQSGAFTRA
jgi:quercetin 2,3-dioxygenase